MFSKLVLSSMALMSATNAAASSWTNGLNMPWGNCGNDWGVAYDSQLFEKSFSKYKASGADTVRYWIHFDGNKQLNLWDGSGNFKKLPSNFYSDAKDMFQRAKNHGLKLHLTMFSFECVNNANCKRMMSGKNGASNAYIQNGLKPFLQFIKNNGFSQQISAIEMFNEPEWMINGGSGVHDRIDKKSVQTFTTKCNKAITDAGFKATVGSASLKFSCKCGKWCEDDYWGNTGQSFRTVHYYSWMSEGGSEFDPFSTKPSDWCLDGDVLVGESPSWTDGTVKHGKITVANQFYLAKQNGWSGVMPWADQGEEANYPNIDQGLKCHTNWNSCKP